MKYVAIESVEAGQLLGKAVYSGNGRVLLAAGVSLTVYMINTLNRIGVTMLYIQDPDFEDINTEDVLSDATKQAVLREMNDSFTAIRSGKEWNSKKIGISAETILEDVMSNKELLIQLTDIRTEDNAHYVHALNVCLISTVIGMNMGLNAIQLKELAIGALLHDVGKHAGGTSTEMSEEVEGEQHQYEELNQEQRLHHAWRGFELLKSKREFSLLIAHVAFQHHEQIDGQGSPRGLIDSEIHLYAKIVAVANRYDNLINTFNGQGRLPHEACEDIMAMSEKELDHEVLVQFTRIISVYPNGVTVRLSTKETGVVVRQHRGLPGRPVIRVVRTEDGRLDITEIDLAQHTTVFIEAVLQ